MTFIVLILLFTLAFGVLLAAELLRAGDGHQAVSVDDLARAEQAVSLEPLQKLLDEQQDERFLHAHPGLAARMSRNRGKVLRMHLPELRREFLRIFAICRLLAPVSKDPELLPKLARCYAGFHLAYASLWIASRTGVALWPRGLRRLSESLQQVRGRADVLLRTDPSPAMSASS